MASRNPFFIPGTTSITARFRPAMSGPTSGHHSPQFGRVLLALLEDIKRTFGSAVTAVQEYDQDGNEMVWRVSIRVAP